PLTPDHALQLQDQCTLVSGPRRPSKALCTPLADQLDTRYDAAPGSCTPPGKQVGAVAKVEWERSGNCLVAAVDEVAFHYCRGGSTRGGNRIRFPPPTRHFPRHLQGLLRRPRA